MTNEPLASSGAATVKERNSAFRSVLHEMTQTTPTRLWCDSASLSELSYTIAHGGVGATCNPVIALSVIKSDLPLWNAQIAELAQEMKTATEEQIAWRLIELMSAKAARLLEGVFDEHGGKNGRLSVQTDPRFYRDANAMLAQAGHFDRIARNIIVKIPATKAGIAAIEEATYQGISINATVSFTVPQAIAVAEAVERGLKRRDAEGKDSSGMGPVCTIMVGRLDDWLKVTAEKQGIIVDPASLDWAGVAVFKKAYQLFQQRRYRTRLLSAAFRNHMHWSEFIGGDVVISPPHAWQVRFNASDIAVRHRIDEPVSAAIRDQLRSKFVDFERAYEENGLTVEEFDRYAPTVRTLRQFTAACADLSALVRDTLLPNPDK